MQGKKRQYRFAFIAPAVAAIAALVLSACGGSSVNKEEFGKIKTAAVLVYTVPPAIEYREDPQENKKSLLQAVVQAAASANPVQAATVSHASFSESLNGKLPFRVLSQDQIRNNAAFTALNVTQYSRKSAVTNDTMKQVLSLMGAKESGAGVAPDFLPQFGLITSYGENPLGSSEDQAKYLAAAMKALNVDAAIVVNDPGYSFSCNACVGGVGDGSTGSAFAVAIVNRNGQLIGGINQWFGTSGGHAAMAAYAVNPLQHDGLFKAHGVKMAEVMVEQLQDDEVLPKK